MKTYVITLSKVFPVTHPRAGEPTFFEQKLFRSTFKEYCGVDVYKNGWLMEQERPKFEPAKLHTIRANYELWRKRFDEIEKGEACLSVRQWTGKPYASKQMEITRLTKEDGIGIQKMEFLAYQDGYRKDAGIWIAGRVIQYDLRELIANNDGLTLQDWDDWFEKYDKTKPLAVIHFTNYRY